MRVLTVAALFLAMSAAVLGQEGGPKTSQGPASQVEQNQNGAGTAQNDQSPVDAQPAPDHVVYLIYFRHLANLDQVAAQREAEGKDGGGWRSHEQRAASLSEEEGYILKRIAYDCLQSVAEVDKKIQNVAAAFLAQHPLGEYLKSGPPPELTQLEEEKARIINAHIDQLKSALGKDAFGKLVLHIAKSFMPSVKQVPASATPKSQVPGGGR